VQLRAAPGWEVDPFALKGYKVVPAAGRPAAKLHATGEAAAWLRIRPVDRATWSQARTEVSLHDDHWLLSHVVRWHGHGALPREASLTVAGVPEGLKLEPGPGLKMTRTDPQTWKIADDATSRPAFFRLNYRVPLTEAARLPLPELLLDGTPAAERHLLLVGPRLRLEKPGDLIAIKSAATDEMHWVIPPAAPPPAVVGQTPQDAALEAPLAQRHATLTHEGAWLHQAAYLLAPRQATEIRFTLPKDARLRAAALDDLPVAARVKDDGYLVAIDGAAGLRRFFLAWDFPSKEKVSQPRLDNPILHNQPGVPVLSTLSLPPGWQRLSSESAFSPAQMRYVAARALTAAVKSGPPQDDSVARLSRRALLEARLAEASTEEPEAAPIREFRKDFSRWLAKAPAPALRPVAATSQLSPLALATGPGAATPPAWSWLARGQTESPRPALATADSLRWARQRRLVEALLVILASILILSLLPRSQAMLRATWPEQLLFLSLLGSLAWGVSLLAVLVAATGLVGRAVWVTRQAARYVQSRRQHPAATGSTT
jgi:hypothetical protein